MGFNNVLPDMPADRCVRDAVITGKDTVFKRMPADAKTRKTDRLSFATDQKKARSEDRALKHTLAISWMLLTQIAR